MQNKEQDRAFNQDQSRLHQLRQDLDAGEQECSKLEKNLDLQRRDNDSLRQSISH